MVKNNLHWSQGFQKVFKEGAGSGQSITVGGLVGAGGAGGGPGGEGGRGALDLSIIKFQLVLTIMINPRGKNTSQDCKTAQGSPMHSLA